MRMWLKSIADLAVDVTVTIVLGVGALVDEWRNGR
jgi:hypothetical protein